MGYRTTSGFTSGNPIDHDLDVTYIWPNGRGVESVILWYVPRLTVSTGDNRMRI